MSDQHVRSAIDRLSRSTTEQRKALEGSAAAPRTAEEQLGLRFKPRDRVVDVATGHVGVVQSGRLSESARRGVYAVVLSTGELVHRDDSELEPLRVPLPIPEASR